MLTPDSSRFWSVEQYEVGKPQSSLDKQPLRDWLVKAGLKGKKGAELPEDVVNATEKRYKEALLKLVGRRLEEDIR